jgi:hypothetical protein
VQPWHRILCCIGATDPGTPRCASGDKSSGRLSYRQHRGCRAALGRGGCPQHAGWPDRVGPETRCLLGTRCSAIGIPVTTILWQPPAVQGAAIQVAAACVDRLWVPLFREGRTRYRQTRLRGIPRLVPLRRHVPFRVSTLVAGVKGRTASPADNDQEDRQSNQGDAGNVCNRSAVQRGSG